MHGRWMDRNGFDEVGGWYGWMCMELYTMDGYEAGAWCGSMSMTMHESLNSQYFYIYIYEKNKREGSILDTWETYRQHILHI